MVEVSEFEIDAMRRALELASAPDLPLGPNPRVSAVVLDDAGKVVGEGAHRGAGTAHAEVAALADAGHRARGGTAVITLEPCAHHGRTGPCTQALIEAGVRRVVYALDDPSRDAGGGATQLRAAGIDVVGGVLAEPARALNPGWLRAARDTRPYIVWKVASTLDGRIAAAHGTSRWITCDESRSEVHLLRSQVDAVITGTGTVVADDPSLTARTSDGPHACQPRRIVVGNTDLAPTAKVFDVAAPTVQFRTHDLGSVVAQLHGEGVRYALVECGPRLAAAFVEADLIDEIRWYCAPIVVGAGASVVADFGVATLADARRFDVVDTKRVGSDVCIRLVARET